VTNIVNDQTGYRFILDGKAYAVKRSDIPVRKKYNLNASRGFPWMTYTGNDRIAGNGYPLPALYSKEDTLGRRFLFSVGPWWIDANHSSPGYGFLSLVFHCLLRPDQKDQHMCFDLSLCYPDMRNMKIRGKIRGHNVDLKGADFVFWFQCYSKKIEKKVNYALTGQTLNDKILDGKINEFELRVDAENNDDWVCLGSCLDKSSIYGNLPIGKIDLDTPINMGFILIPIDVRPIWSEEYLTTLPINLIKESAQSMWPVKTNLLPEGTIAFYELEIDYYSHYQIFHIGSA